MDHEIDEAALLGVATAADHKISRHQLKRWRRAGLLPRPRIEHREGVRGSRSWYPAWTAEQLLAVARLHLSVHRLDALRIAVWWERRWVEPGALRTALIAPLERLSQKARALGAGSGDPYDAADAMVEAAAAEGSRSQVLGLFSKRVGGRANTMNLLWAFLVIGLGGEAPWDEEDRSASDAAPTALQLLAAGTGVERPRRDGSSAPGPLVPPGFNLRDLMNELRSVDAFDVADAARPIREATDADLTQAREDALVFAEQLPAMRPGVEGVLDKDIPILAAVDAMRPKDAFDRAALIRSMLVLRRLTGELLDATTALVSREYARLTAIADLRAAFPQHRAVLTAEVARRLAELPPAEATQVLEDIRTYLNEHPEAARAIHHE